MIFEINLSTIVNGSNKDLIKFGFDDRRLNGTARLGHFFIDLTLLEVTHWKNALQFSGGNYSTFKHSM